MGQEVTFFNIIFVASCEITDRWETIKLFILPLYFSPLFSQRVQTSEAIVCLLFSHFFQSFPSFRSVGTDPRWFVRNSWDFPTNPFSRTHTHTFFLKKYVGFYSWVHNKCVFYSDFPISWAWWFSIWLIAALFQSSVRERLRLKLFSNISCLQKTVILL